MYEDCFTSILFSGGFILFNLSAKTVLNSFSRFIQMGQMDWQTACNVHGGDGSRPAPSRRDNNIHKNIFNLCILLYNGDPQHRMLCPLLSNAEISKKEKFNSPKVEIWSPKLLGNTVKKSNQCCQFYTTLQGTQHSVISAHNYCTLWRIRGESGGRGVCICCVKIYLLLTRGAPCGNL